MAIAVFVFSSYATILVLIVIILKFVRIKNYLETIYKYL